ncbi:DNA topoisomerase IA [Streptomyces sp. V1I1]|nr:DNA topoisomerase IA [Streptomyces sp. V1I1]
MSPTSETAQGGRRLVIVESPAKAKTIKGYLGPGYVVEASVGHIRDLPNGAAEVPEKYTGEVRRLGVDVENDFQPIYVVNADKKAQVRKLKEQLAESDELFLATDEDREGEAIAWHLLEVLKPKVPVHRMVFHEITKDAIREAVENPRELNKRMGRRPGDPPYPRPSLRLRGLAGPVEEGHAAALRRPCAVRRHPPRRRA